MVYVEECFCQNGIILYIVVGILLFSFNYTLRKSFQENCFMSNSRRNINKEFELIREKSD